MGKDRQIRKQKEVRNKILDVARDIISKEGIQGLSIRKITSTIDYSPGIIYHYFNNKDEIIKALVNEGYKKILESINSVEQNITEPDKEIKEIAIKYIEAALKSPEEYKAFMLNDETQVMEKTRLLEKGISKKSKTLQLLSDKIQQGISRDYFTPVDPELTAQIIWVSIFGLTIKLIFEKDISQEQINRLIDHQLNILFNGIKANK